MSTSTGSHLAHRTPSPAARGVVRALLVTGATLALLPGAAALAGAAEPDDGCTQVSAESLGRDEGPVSVPLGDTGVTLVRHRDQVWVEGDTARVRSLTTTSADESTHPGGVLDGRLGDEVSVAGYLAVTVCVDPAPTTTSEVVVPPEEVVPTDVPPTGVVPTGVVPPTGTATAPHVTARAEGPTTTAPARVAAPEVPATGAITTHPADAAPAVPPQHAPAVTSEPAGAHLAVTGTPAATVAAAGAVLAAVGASLVVWARTVRRRGTR